MGNWLQRLFWPEQPANPAPANHPQYQQELIATVVEPDAGLVRRRAPQSGRPNDQGHPQSGQPNDQGHPQLGQPNYHWPPQSSNGSAVEAPQPSDDDDDAAFEPYGRQGYPFEDSAEVSLVYADSTIGSKTIQAVQALASEVVMIYRSLVQLREGVRESLQGFKAALGLQQTAELTACFYELKSAAGRRSQIDIVQQDRDSWRLDVDELTLEELSEQTRTAVTHFQNLLRNASDFLNRKQESIDVIEGKLAQMRQQCDYQVSIGQYNQVKDTPTEIRKLAKEIKRFLHDMDIAKIKLKGNITGTL